MDSTDIINLILRIMTISGLVAGLAFLILQLLIKKLERSKEFPCPDSRR